VFFHNSLTQSLDVGRAISGERMQALFPHDQATLLVRYASRPLERCLGYDCDLKVVTDCSLHKRCPHDEFKLAKFYETKGSDARFSTALERLPLYSDQLVEGEPHPKERNPERKRTTCDVLSKSQYF
jgi:hypothetical protein